MSSSLQAMRSWVDHRRSFLLGAAALIFAGGLAWSINGLDLASRRIDPALMLWALVFSAISIVANTEELRLCARAAGTRLGFRSAMACSSWATVANILPISASILIRGGALRSAGADWGRTGAVILAAGLMWIAMAAAISGHALFPGWGGRTIAAVAALASLGILGWIWRVSGLAVALGFALVRAVMLGLLILRLRLLFLALGVPMSLGDVSIFALAGIVGNSVAIVPAGIGVTETLGALLAEVASHSPEVAFLVLAINRIMGLALSGAFALASGMKPAAALKTRRNDARVV